MYRGESWLVSRWSGVEWGGVTVKNKVWTATKPIKIISISLSII